MQPTQWHMSCQGRPLAWSSLAGAESVARFAGWSAIMTRPGRGGNLSRHP